MDRMPPPFDFAQAPLLVIWECTRSCALACRHCRADADLRRDPDELSTVEGQDILRQTQGMGTPIFVLSGGDPLVREDLEVLVKAGKGMGLRMGTIPAATPSLTRERLQSLRDAGLDQVAFSIDGPDAVSHDAFRQTPGAFDRVIQGVQWAQELGLNIQINTCLAAWNFAGYDKIEALVRGLPIAFWEFFFLIPVGRGAQLGGLEPQQFEEVFEKLWKLSRQENFVVKLTEGQHFRRFVMQKEAAAGAGATERTVHAVARSASLRAGIRLPKRAVNAGDGFMFIDHLGGICPSGFLPEVRGNVRRDQLAKVYREDELFIKLRDHDQLIGRCGVCEYRQICGGSRARAFAVTGNVWETDPACAHQPAAWTSDRKPSRRA